MAFHNQNEVIKYRYMLKLLRNKKWFNLYSRPPPPLPPIKYFRIGHRDCNSCDWPEAKSSAIGPSGYR